MDCEDGSPDSPIISRRLALIGWQKLLYKLQEFPRPVRFSNVCVAANCSGFLIVTAEGEGCDSNYRDTTEVLPRFDPAARFESRNTGQLNIHEYQVWTLALSRRKRFFAVHYLYHLKAFEFQQVPNDHSVCRIILNVEYSHAHSRPTPAATTRCGTTT